MLDLIDRNAMLKTLENSGVLGKFAKFLIKKQPTVDAVEVVRCKDCKHYNNSLCTYSQAKGYRGCATCVEENDFCSYDERKDGEPDANGNDIKLPKLDAPCKGCDNVRNAVI